MIRSAVFCLAPFSGVLQSWEFWGPLIILLVAIGMSDTEAPSYLPFSDSRDSAHM